MSFTLSNVRRKRCPAGTRRNKRTGLCEPYNRVNSKTNKLRLSELPDSLELYPLRSLPSLSSLPAVNSSTLLSRRSPFASKKSLHSGQFHTGRNSDVAFDGTFLLSVLKNEFILKNSMLACKNIGQDLGALSAVATYKDCFHILFQGVHSFFPASKIDTTLNLHIIKANPILSDVLCIDMGINNVLWSLHDFSYFIRTMNQTILYNLEIAKNISIVCFVVSMEGKIFLVFTYIDSSVYPSSDMLVQNGYYKDDVALYMFDIVIEYLKSTFDDAF